VFSEILRLEQSTGAYSFVQERLVIRKTRLPVPARRVLLAAQVGAPAAFQRGRSPGREPLAELSRPAGRPAVGALQGRLCQAGHHGGIPVSIALPSLFEDYMDLYGENAVSLQAGMPGLRRFPRNYKSS